MPPGSLHRAVARWHFTAGLVLLPIMLWLAVTGGLYLYKPEIERWWYRDVARVEPRGAVLPVGRMVALVERQTGAAVIKVARPASPAESWRITLGGTGDTLAFVDPYSGRVLGRARAGGVMALVRELHSLAITGPVGNAVVEIAAGWAIVLVVTGVYLWWPRGGAPALPLRATPRRRLFWRDLHAGTGTLAAAVILFLAVTGLPWTGVWGAWLGRQVAANDLGRPAPPAAGGGHGEHGGDLPWTVRHAGAPHAGVGRDIGPDRVVRIAAERGLAAPWTLTRPAASGKPYSVSATVVRAEDARVLFIDPASGAVLQDARYAGFGMGAKAIEWGIATHQGQEYGEANRLLMLAGCFAIVLLSISAPVMWWMRRGRGAKRGSPPADRHGARAVLAAMLVLGAALPLTGLSMLAALLVGAGRRRRVAPG